MAAMSAALFIVLERQISGLDSYVNGKALSWAEESLDGLANQLGVTPLMAFFSIDPAEAAETFAETLAELGEPKDGAAEPSEFPEEEWFSAEEGLQTVNALLAHFAEHPRAVRDADAVISDLREFQAVLQRAGNEGVRWHLAVDC